MTDQITPIEGTTGSEAKFYCPLTSAIMEPGEVDEMRANLGPRNLAKFNRSLVAITETWTWVKYGDRFNPGCFQYSRSDVKYIDQNGQAI